jgi:hypothetical protein
MEDPTKEPTLEQRVAMAKRLNEVGPFLPRYIKRVELRKEAHGITKADIEESKGIADDTAERRAASAKANDAPYVAGISRRRAIVKKEKSAVIVVNGVPLKKICAAIDLDPRVARRILRAKGAKPGGRWEWPEAEIEGVKKTLQAERSKYEGKP